MPLAARTMVVLVGGVIASVAVVSSQARQPTAQRAGALASIATGRFPSLAEYPVAPSRHGLAPQAAARAAAPVVNRALLDKYCVSCHNDRRKASAGGLALDQIDTTRIGDNAQAAPWFAKVPGEITDADAQAWVIAAADQQRRQPREWFA